MNQKGFSALVLLLGIAIFALSIAGAYYLGEQRVIKTLNQETNSQQIPTLTIPNNCKQNSRGDISSIMRTYVVQKGDSLLSISRKELGDPSRYQELAVLNGDKYPVFFSSPGVVSQNAFLEQEWTLLLPPEWIKSTSGSLDIINGMVLTVRPNDHALEITSKNDRSGHYATLTLDNRTINPNDRSFKSGDCITAVRDVDRNKVLKIDLQ